MTLIIVKAVTIVIFIIIIIYVTIINIKSTGIITSTTTIIIIIIYVTIINIKSTGIITSTTTTTTIIIIIINNIVIKSSSISDVQGDRCESVCCFLSNGSSNQPARRSLPVRIRFPLPIVFQFCFIWFPTRSSFQKGDFHGNSFHKQNSILIFLLSINFLSFFFYLHCCCHISLVLFFFAVLILVNFLHVVVVVLANLPLYFFRCIFCRTGSNFITSHYQEDGKM